MSQFEKHINDESTIDVNGNPWNYGLYNLVIFRSQLKLYVNTGLKPNSSWSVKLVNDYFGIKPGTRAKTTYEIVNNLYTKITE